MKSFRKFVEENGLSESPIYEEESCPVATQNLKVNTKNRDAAIKEEHIQYGPLNVNEPGDYWKDIAEYWDTTENAAKKSNCGNCVAFDISERMKECMPGKTSDDDGELGYCWMHHFKCHSARSCRTWAKGGPIDKDKVSLEWQEKANIDEGYGSGLSESVEMDTLKGIADKLKKEYGFEASLSKSTLGGGEPTYFLKVFGPKDTWKNGIAMNSPFHATFSIDDGVLEMTNHSYQVRNAKAKMRKTKYKNDTDLEKKMMDYFKKNKSKIDGILGESVISESTIDKMRDMVNKKTKDRILILGGKPIKVSLKDASYLITLYDNQSSKQKKELEKEMSTRDGLKSVIDDLYEENRLNEELPAHLQRHFNKDGSKVNGKWVGTGKNRKWVPTGKKTRKAKDVTPKGYGPNEAKDSINEKKLGLLNALSVGEKKIISIADKNKWSNVDFDLRTGADQEMYNSVFSLRRRGYIEFKKISDKYPMVKMKIKMTDKGSQIEESKDSYQINHKTFSSAVQHAKQQVEKRGYEIDDDEWDRKVATGPRKPSRGKTNIYTIDLMKNGKESRRKLQMQVYYDEGRYELNMYIS